MNTLRMTAFSLAFLGACAAAEEESPAGLPARYVVVQHSVAVAGRRAGPAEVVLKLDTAGGCVWRLDGTDFIAVASDPSPRAKRLREGQD